MSLLGDRDPKIVQDCTAMLVFKQTVQDISHEDSSFSSSHFIFASGGCLQSLQQKNVQATLGRATCEAAPPPGAGWSPSGSHPFYSDGGRAGGVVACAGNVTSFKYFEEGPNGNFPIGVADVDELRTGDYSAIYLGEDGFVYASSQHTQRIPSVNGSFNWGEPPFPPASLVARSLSLLGVQTTMKPVRNKHLCTCVRMRRHTHSFGFLPSRVHVLHVCFV